MDELEAVRDQALERGAITPGQGCIDGLGDASGLLLDVLRNGTWILEHGQRDKTRGEDHGCLHVTNNTTVENSAIAQPRTIGMRPMPPSSPPPRAALSAAARSAQKP